MTLSIKIIENKEESILVELDYGTEKETKEITHQEYRRLAIQIAGDRYLQYCLSTEDDEELNLDSLL
jgi:hypothetical protein